MLTDTTSDNASDTTADNASGTTADNASGTTADNVYTDEVRLTSHNIDAFYTARLNYYFALVQDIPAFHTFARGVSIPDLNREDKSWMILRSHLKISRYAAWAETLRVSTWALPAAGLRCPRGVIARDANNAELFRANTLWCIVNTKTHHPVRPASVNERLGLVTSSPLSDELPPKPVFPKTPYVQYTPVYPDYFAFDYNGHLNNVSYIDLILSSFSPDFLKANLVSEVDIVWTQEIRPADIIAVKTFSVSPAETYASLIRIDPDSSSDSPDTSDTAETAETSCCTAHLLWKPRSILS